MNMRVELQEVCFKPFIQRPLFVKVGTCMCQGFSDSLQGCLNFAVRDLWSHSRQKEKVRKMLKLTRSFVSSSSKRLFFA